MRGTLKRIPDRVLKESLPEMAVQLRNQVSGWEQVLGCRVRPRLSDLTEAPIENERRSVQAFPNTRTLNNCSGAN
jgi:hypothetical protein